MDDGKNENASSTVLFCSLFLASESAIPCGDQNFLMFLLIEILMFSSFSTGASISIS